jgi:hypothetical protein
MFSMNKIHDFCWQIPLLVLMQGIFCDGGNTSPRTTIESTPKNNNLLYTPIQLPPNGEAIDALSDRDIPTGDGGFARDYTIQLIAGDRIEIYLTSESFDPVVILLNAEGKSVGKNDDGGDGTSNSLLFSKIKTSGKYIIRVQAFGATSSGGFKLKVSKLQEK